MTSAGEKTPGKIGSPAFMAVFIRSSSKAGVMIYAAPARWASHMAASEVTVPAPRCSLVPKAARNRLMQASPSSGRLKDTST